MLVDGVVVQTDTNAGAIGGTYSTTRHLTFGCYWNSEIALGQYFLGDAYELRLWNIARDTADILADKDWRLVGNESGLVGYWKCDEGAGASASDSVGANNGTIHDAIWVT